MAGSFTVHFADRCVSGRSLPSFPSSWTHARRLLRHGLQGFRGTRYRCFADAHGSNFRCAGERVVLQRVILTAVVRAFQIPHGQQAKDQEEQRTKDQQIPEFRNGSENGFHHHLQVLAARDQSEGSQHPHYSENPHHSDHPTTAALQKPGLDTVQHRHNDNDEVEDVLKASQVRFPAVSVVAEGSKCHNLHHDFKEKNDREDRAKNLQDLYFHALGIAKRILKRHDHRGKSDEHHDDMIKGWNPNQGQASFSNLSFPRE
mmetsp:Transcript_5305/g.8661  ORF Transcript_5305/g.8661 Transcript_5305/m.8661 type:complete len:259 (+) Transcript_5305:1235-2011(+)